MDYIKPMFQIPIFSKVLKKEVLESITTEALNYISNNPKEFKATWRCPTKNNIKTPKSNSFQSKTLEKELGDSIAQYHKFWEFQSCTLQLNNLWINIAPPEAYQEAHVHLSHYSKVLYSGVLYLKTEENSGDIFFNNPITPLLYHMLPSPKITAKQLITPHPGLILMFPSWLEHGVLQNKTTKDRISISWNFEASPPPPHN